MLRVGDADEEERRWWAALDAQRRSLLSHSASVGSLRKGVVASGALPPVISRSIAATSKVSQQFIQFTFWCGQDPLALPFNPTLGSSPPPHPPAYARVPL
jgi:hypothetical protein